MLPQQPFVAAKAAVETTARPATAAILASFFFTLRSFLSSRPDSMSRRNPWRPCLHSNSIPITPFSLCLIVVLRASQPRIERREHKQGQQSGREQSSNDDGGQGPLHLSSGAVGHRHRNEAERSN